MAVEPTHSERLIGREDLLRQLRGLLSEARAGRGQVVLVEGEAGIGKSALLEWLRSEAANAGVNVLSARASDADSSFAFALASRLLQPPRRGPGGAGAIATTEERLHHWLALHRRDRRPLALVVDDLQQADAASLGFLRALAADRSGLLLLAYRPDARVASTLAGIEPMHVLRVGPLDADASARFVRARIPGADEGLCEACARAAGGHPFLLRELVSALEDRRREGAALTPELVHALAPPTVTRSMRARLDDAGPQANAVARSLAVLGDQADVETVAALAGLDPRAVAEAAEWLRDGGILGRGKRRLAFAYSLLRTSVYAALGPGERTLAHERAAELLAGGPPRVVADHLLKTERGAVPHAAAPLMQAARQAPPARAVAFLHRALEEPTAPAVRTEILLELAASELELGDADAAAEHAVQVLDAGAGRLSVPELAADVAWTLTLAGQDEVALGLHQATGEERRRGERSGAALEVIRRDVQGLLLGDRLDRARERLAAALADAEERASVPSLLALAPLRAHLALLEGRLADAEADARRALELARAHGWTRAAREALSMLLAALLDEGKLDEADSVLSQVDSSTPVDADLTGVMLLAGRARLRLARGDTAAGVGDLLELRRLLADMGLAGEAALFAVADAAPALSFLGEPDRARRLAQDLLERSRAQSTPRAVGIALRGLALVEPEGRRVALLRESVAALESSPARLELARSLVELGAALRRAGARREARAPLRAGLEQARQCGASGLLQRARHELEASAEHLSRDADRLTPSERRAADLAAAGMPSRAIAQVLQVTPRTVDAYLGRAYRKLGIASRRQLPSALRELAE